jgi:hypothetical protein
MLLTMLRADSWGMTVMHAVLALRLPDAAVGAGFIRSMVWDVAHGYNFSTPLADVDVLFFDRLDRSRGREARLEKSLRQRLPGIPFSVRNQARMHWRNGDRPYRDTTDAMGFWLETATCVAVSPRAGGAMTVLAPHSLDDLLSLRSRPTQAGQSKPGAYQARMAAKDWPSTWPHVVVAG